MISILLNFKVEKLSRDPTVNSKRDTCLLPGGNYLRSTNDLGVGDL